MLNELYDSIKCGGYRNNNQNIERSTFFIDDIAKETPFYYSPSGDMNISMWLGMLITDKNNVYVGGFKDKNERRYRSSI